MSNQFKKNVSIIGMAVGLIIIIIGFCVMNPETYLLGSRDSLGSLIKFGADFYTEIYHMTYSAAHQVQKAYVNICNAIGWLIIAIGAINICFFAYAFAKTLETSNHSSIKNIDKNVQLMAGPIIRETEEKARREAEEKARREAEEKARREAEVAAEREIAAKAKQIIQKKEKTLSEKLAYALMFQSDDGMISYLKNLQDEAVQDILKSPQHLIREQIENLLEHM